MSEVNLRQIIEEVVKSYYDTTEVKNTQEKSTTVSHIDEGAISDITKYTMEKYLHVPNPENKDAYMNYKKNTPARVGIWRAGPRYTTETMLRFRADHAIAQDAVFSNVSEELIEEKGWPSLKTVINEKDEYLTRPDLGRILDDHAVEELRRLYPQAPKVLVYLSDGLSSIAVETNGYDTFKSIEMGLKSKGIEVAAPFFLKYGRVPAMDHVAEVTGAEVTAVLIGERPGLATGESMSCYMIYKGKVGNIESLRTVVSNIHRNGTQAVEAGAYIADIIQRILDEKKSGVDLKL
jgi:ethanolamine ammonia-lyase small subunit